MVDLQQKLKTATANGKRATLDLNAAETGIAGIESHLAPLVKGSVLRLRAISEPRVEDGKLRFKGATSLAGVPDEVVAEASFEPPSAPTRFSLSLSLPAGWKFSQSFPDLPSTVVTDPLAAKSTFLDLLRPLLAEPVLIVSDHAVEGYSHGGTGSLVTVNLKKGTSLIARLGIAADSDGLFGAVGALLGEHEITLVGNLDFELQYLSLTANFATSPIELGPLEIQDLGITVFSALSSKALPMAGCDLHGSFAISGLRFRLQSSVPLSGGSWEFQGYFDGLTLPGLNRMAEAIGVAELENVLPDVLQGLPELSLKRAAFALSDKKALRSIELDLETDRGWKIVDGFLELKSGITLSLGVIFPEGKGKKEVSFGVGGDMLLFGADFEVVASLPEKGISGNLKKGETLDLKHFMATWLPAVAVPDDLKITGLVLGGDFTGPSFVFHAWVQGTWRVLGKNVDLELRELEMGLLYSGGQPSSVEGDVRALFEIAGVDLEVHAVYSKGSAGAGLVFTATAGKSTAIPLGKILADLADRFGLSDGDPPRALAGLEVRDFQVSFNTRTKDFTSHCEIDLEVAKDKKLDLIADLNLTHQPDGKTAKHFSGILRVAGLEFDLLFDQNPEAKQTAFLALYKNPGGGQLSLKKLVEAVSGESIDLLDKLGFKLKDVLLVYEAGQKAVVQPPQSATPSKYLFALDMDAGLDLSGLGHLPLIGKLLPADQTLALAFQPILTPKDAKTPATPKQSKQWTPEEVTAIKALMPEGSPHLPDKLGPGFSFVTTLRIGNLTKTLEFGAAAKEKGSKLDPKLDPAKANQLDPGLGSPKQTPQPPPAAQAPDPAGDLAAKPKDNKWIELQKHFGPLHLQRVGLGFKDNKISAMIDAALAIGPLEFALFGLGARYDLSSKDLSFTLEGLALDFKQGPLEISAAFLRFGEEFAGKAVLRTETLTLGALGAYGKHQGHPSLFLYAFLNYPIGGPVFFFVEGLAAGFGYNRRLILPPVTEIYRFPLVSEVIADPNAPKPPDAAIGPKPDPIAAIRAEMTRLERYVPPQLNQYFLAAGLKFNSFRLIDCFALLAVNFGRPLEIDLMGVASLKIPSDSPELLAEVELEFAARMCPEEGFLGVQAQLTPRSFLLSRSCHLQGGFAFSAWFLGQHAGDFIYTMGGYHPHFAVPAHYPRVPHLGFNWSIDEHLSIKGYAYYALASTAAMAGGGLDAAFHSGSLEAWFRLGLNILIAWKPYHYEADAFVEIGARLNIDVPVVGNVRVSIDAGAELSLWGPEFSGKGKVHVKVMGVKVSFSVSFEASGSDKPPALTWEQFAKAFLPAAPKVVTIAVTSGLLRTLGERWVVDPKHLKFATNAVIPTKSGPPDAQPLPAGRGVGEVGVASMDLAAADFKDSKHTIRATRDGQYPATEDFAFRPIVKRFPKALWGVTRDPHKSLNAGMVEAVAGYEVTPAKPAPPGASSRVERRHLDYEVTPRDMAVDDGRRLSFTAADGELPAALRQVPKARGELLTALGFHPAKDVRLSDDLADTFVLEPRLVRGAAA